MTSATESQPMSIVICMGSSCFSRGNNRNIEVIQSFLAENRGAVTIELRGHLCENQCKQGPNILIDGKLHHDIDPVTLTGLLVECLDRHQKAGP